MNGVAGHSWLTLTTLTTLPVRPCDRITESTAPIPLAVQYGRRPFTPLNAPTCSLREQTSVSRLGVPVSPLTFGFGRTSTMDSGPRLDAPVDVGSYPAPALEGRLWKYFGIGLPFASVNDCPITAEPTTLPSRWISEPFARCCRPGI